MIDVKHVREVLRWYRKLETANFGARHSAVASYVEIYKDTEDVALISKMVKPARFMANVYREVHFPDNPDSGLVPLLFLQQETLGLEVAVSKGASAFSDIERHSDRIAEMITLSNAIKNGYELMLRYR
jgi:hypothetical protein